MKSFLQSARLMLIGFVAFSWQIGACMFDPKLGTIAYIGDNAPNDAQSVSWLEVQAVYRDINLLAIEYGYGGGVSVETGLSLLAGIGAHINIIVVVDLDPRKRDSTIAAIACAMSEGLSVGHLFMDTPDGGFTPIEVEIALNPYGYIPEDGMRMLDATLPETLPDWHADEDIEG